MAEPLLLTLKKQAIGNLNDTFTYYLLRYEGIVCGNNESGLSPMKEYSIGR